MITKELESLIKNCLATYAQDYNRINPKGKIDFNVTFTVHKLDSKTIPGYDPEDEDYATVTKYNGQDMHYMRISKQFLGKTEKRLIFVAYRPVKEYKKVDEAKKSMLMECLRQLIIAGVEYCEAMHQMSENQEQEDDSEKPEMIVEK